MCGWLVASISGSIRKNCTDNIMGISHDGTIPFLTSSMCSLSRLPCPPEHCAFDCPCVSLTLLCWVLDYFSRLLAAKQGCSFLLNFISVVPLLCYLFWREILFYSAVYFFIAKYLLCMRPVGVILPPTLSREDIIAVRMPPCSNDLDIHWLSWICLVNFD